MSFDRAGIINHNHHVQTRYVQTRADFLPNSARHGPGRGLPCASSALSAKGSLEFIMCGRLADCPRALPYDGHKGGSITIGRRHRAKASESNMRLFMISHLVRVSTLALVCVAALATESPARTPFDGAWSV